MRVPSWPTVVVLCCVAAPVAAQAPRGRLPRLEATGGQPAGGQPAGGQPVGGQPAGGGAVPWTPAWPGAAPGPRPRGAPPSAGRGHPHRVRPRVIVVGLPFWYLGSGFGLAAWDWSAGAAPDGAAASRVAPVRSVPATRVIEVGAATSAIDAGTRAEPRPVAVEPLAGGRLRVRWTGEPPVGGEVTLLVADAAGRTLATRTVRAAPWAADFAHTPRVAFVGVAVPRDDGGRTTTLLPLARPAAAP